MTLTLLPRLIPLLLILLPLVLLKISKQINYFYVVGCCLVGIVLGTTFQAAKYRDINALMGNGNYYYIHSQINSYYDEIKSDFVEASNTKTQFTPLKKENLGASQYLSIPYSNKILFIVAESLGGIRNPQLRNEMFKNIQLQKNQLDYFNTGYVYARGATVQGELRELCSGEARFGLA